MKSVNIVPFLQEHMNQILKSRSLEELTSIALEVIGSRTHIGYLEGSKPFSEMSTEEVLAYETNLDFLAECNKGRLVFFNPLPFKYQIETLRQEAEMNLEKLLQEHGIQGETMKEPEAVKKARITVRHLSNTQDGEVISRFYRHIFQKCERLFFLPGYEATSIRRYYSEAEKLQLDTKRLPSGWQGILKKAA